MEYNVIIYKKNIKNVILKVKHNGIVTLSVPKKTPNSFIEIFLNSKKEWILKNLEKIKKNSTKAVDKSYKNGDNIEYLGKIYILEIFKSSSNKICVEDKYFKIYTTKEINKKNIEAIIYKWYKDRALEIFKISLNKYSNLIGEKFIDFKIRKMKRRWGSCRFVQRIITLNIELIKKPIECIDYVSLHEVAHLKHPHHKKEFWDFISIYMPDWKLRKERLDKYD
jgi:predicted metal-dependent hydrolase